MTLELDLRAVGDERTRRYVADGSWTDDTLGTILAAGLVDGRDLPLAIHSQTRPWRGTFADGYDLACRVAGGLRAHGVRPGDPVAFQLPNWVEAAATFWAIALLGAVPVPIVHFYGAKEVSFILEQSEAQVLVTADEFGHLDYLANLESFRPRLDALREVFVVGDRTRAGTRPFAELAAGDPIPGPVTTDPSSPALIAYTSGTTADPKGVVHSHRTIGFEIRQLGAIQAKGGLPTLVGAPVGHGIGMLAALLIPVWRRDPIQLIDVWDPARVLATMLEEGISSGNGATYFLISLLDHPDFTDAHRRLMPYIGLGGSAVPAAVGERCARMGISTVRSFGSTEHPSITGMRHDAPTDKKLHTDGKALPGVELQLRDDDGHVVDAGTPGEIWSKGPDCFVGYTDPALTAAAFGADGWFATGDIGVLDADGYLAIVDRKKDIIIRGGENVSALEVEEQVLRLPGVAEVAVVAAPDVRLGEHGCAFVRMQPGAAPPSLEVLRDHLTRSGLARQKWPEEIRGIDEFPRTPSGKVQKFVLRQRLRDVAV
ncbi:MAG TPA: AMP-binding protein [Acidimicrobiia bacterium]|nr:AMP-binding protein [Acidimicrobiia bacterium]